MSEQQIQRTDHTRRLKMLTHSYLSPLSHTQEKSRSNGKRRSTVKFQILTAMNWMRRKAVQAPSGRRAPEAQGLLGFEWGSDQVWGDITLQIVWRRTLHAIWRA